jgi:nitroreductase
MLPLRLPRQGLFAILAAAAQALWLADPAHHISATWVSGSRPQCFLRRLREVLMLHSRPPHPFRAVRRNAPYSCGAISAFSRCRTTRNDCAPALGATRYVDAVKAGCPLLT